jgi:hypothetical protein
MAWLKLFRVERTEKHTVGTLCDRNVLIAHTMELPWKDNKRGESCIPEGIYHVVPDSTGKHRYFRVLDVDGRDMIEIHKANWAFQLDGCIACGEDIKDHEKGRMVTNSEATMDALKEKYPYGFILEIRSV